MLAILDPRILDLMEKSLVEGGGANGGEGAGLGISKSLSSE